MAGAEVNGDKVDEILTQVEIQNRTSTFIIMLLVIGLIFFVPIYYGLNLNTLVSKIDKTITSLDNLRGEVKRRILVMEKTTHYSRDYKNATGISERLTRIHNELVDTKELIESLESQTWND